ncbi:MAG: hypothetical protein IIA41_05435 [SAR324 cluster bacterium]|nr:hypothetical protein [SAR324 cluster bacterium]
MPSTVAPPWTSFCAMYPESTPPLSAIPTGPDVPARKPGRGKLKGFAVVTGKPMRHCFNPEVERK